MIARFAVDSRAVTPPEVPGLDHRLEQARLVEALSEYGLLSVLGDADSDELLGAIRRLATDLGYDFWGPFLRAATSTGPGLVRADPGRAQSVRDCCDAGKLADLRDDAEVVVLASEPRIPHLGRDRESDLYDRRGSTAYSSDLELALAKAIDMSGTIKRLRTLRAETLIPAGSQRAEVWANYFELLAATSTEVNIFDRYLFSGLVKTDDRPRPNVWYLLNLLESLGQSLPADATVNLFALDGATIAASNTGGNPQPYTPTDISKSLSRPGGWGRPGNLHVYLAKSLDHDRHIRFSSGYALMPQAGFDRLRFRQDGTLSRPFSYSFVTPGNGLSQRAKVENLPRNTAEHWILRNRRLEASN